MGKGYAEGPAAEERYEAFERGERAGPPPATRERSGVYGATADRPEKHFIGWLGEVDPDELFASGTAWGISVIRLAEHPSSRD